MEFLYNLFLVLHFIGLAGLLGGLLTQIPNKPKRLEKLVLHSAWLMFLAGVIMVGINQMMHSDDPTVAVLDHTQTANPWLEYQIALIAVQLHAALGEVFA